MGCDILFYVERKTPEGWALVKPNAEEADDFGREYGTFYHDRNYALFAALADVRNGYGFAGCDTGDRIQPICDPRGLPEDASEAVREEYQEWGSDAHSASWLTLAELKAYDWHQGTVVRGFVTEKQYAELKGGKLPESWSGGVSGWSVAAMTAAQYEELTEEQKKDWRFLRENFCCTLGAPAYPIGAACEPMKIYVQAEWTRSLMDRCRAFVEKTIPLLSTLGADDEVRAVFWFDN